MIEARPPIDRHLLPRAAGPLQAFAMFVIQPYFLNAYRIRGWGRLPRKRGATLLLCNHQHDLDTTGTIMPLEVQGPWMRPIYAVASRRLFEPGFMSARRKWLEPFMRTVNFGWMFRAIGMLPMENEPRVRPVAAFAYAVYAKHPDARIGDVFAEDVVAKLDVEPSAKLPVLFAEPYYHPARDAIVSLSTLREPHRSELVAQMRANMEADLERIENVLRGGGTLYLTPEGHYTKDGRLLRFKMTLGRLRALADIYTLSLSYDPFVAKRLSLLYRLQPALSRDDLESAICAPRPIVVSQLLGAFLATRTTAFSEADAIAAVRAGLSALPRGAFVDPELSADPDGMTRKALVTMPQLDLLALDGAEYRLTSNRRYVQFPDVPDLISHQANMFAETLKALQTLGM